MKPLARRATRQLVLGLTLLVALAVVGVVLGLTQTARASVASLETSTKAVSPDQVSPGSVITYTIVVRNDAASAVSSVVVTDVLPAEVTYVPLSAHSIPEGAGVPSFDIPDYRRITFTIATVPANSEVSLIFRAQVKVETAQDTVFTNTASISDGVTTLSRSATATVQAPPEIAIKTPWDNQLLTERGVFAITGRAWTADQTPGFPGQPVLSTTYVPGNNFYFVQWTSVPGALAYVLQEALDPHFAQLTSYNGNPATSPVYFSGKAPGTYYYRVQARNAYEGFWSDAIAVVVTSSATASSGAMQPLTAEALLYQPTVEINIKPVGGADSWRAATSTTLNAGGWWDWSYNWTLPEEDGVQYVIQARAKDQAGNPGAVDTLTVTIRNGKSIIYMPIIMRRWPPVPYPPTLTKPNDDGAGNYTLTWTYTHAELPPTQGYRFQEATDAAFTNLTINEIRSSPQVFTNKPVGTYYYRVAGINNAGLGEWSNVEQVRVVRGYFDDFSNNTSGWPRSVVRQDGRDVFDRAYETANATYRAKIMLHTGGLNNYRVGTVRAPWENPYSSYEVEVQHYFARAGDQAADPMAGKGGLIFGGNANLTTFFVLEWNFEGDCAVSKYVNAGAPISDPRFTSRVALKNWGPCGAVRKGYNQINTARVVVEDNRATAYINGQSIGSYTDGDLRTLHHVGFLTGAWERTPVEGRYDNFRVTPR